MSYSLFLHFKPRVQRADVLKYFAARRHYKIAKDRVSYANEDTGAYFRFDLRYRRDVLLRQTVVSAEFEINYHRPSFFALEAEQELSAFVEAFGLGIEDPQMHGMGNGPYSPHGFFSGWNFGNRFALQQALSTGSEQKIMTMPAAELQAVWDWNNDCAERRDRMNLRYYVPTILFLAHRWPCMPRGRVGGVDAHSAAAGRLRYRGKTDRQNASQSRVLVSGNGSCETRRLRQREGTSRVALSDTATCHRRMGCQPAVDRSQKIRAPTSTSDPR
jgi:hypothetical protein